MDQKKNELEMKRESKIIIGIHGLGNKPPKSILENWWKQAIRDGLKLNNFRGDDFEFEIVYWADILHPIPLDVTAKNNSLTNVDEQYTSEVYTERKIPLTFRERAIEYLEKYYNNFIVNEVLSLKYPSITEFFIHLHLKDLKTYYSMESIPVDGTKILAKEAIINRIINTLNRHKEKKILLIAHSMGSLIAHDAFTEKSRKIKIDTYVTIGSPLGQKYVIHKYETEKQQNLINKLVVPENILSKWYNLSDLQDQIALNHELKDLYRGNPGKVKIEDQLVVNNFISNGIRNPHKAFGYLRTPEFSKIVNDFLIPKKLGLFNWIKNILRV
jgi:hypothetical protein